MPEYKDYYEILGVPRDAKADDIKRAYRKLAREHHPDLAASKSEAEQERAERRFKDVNEANQVLGDVEARKRYDGLGSGWRHGESFTGAGGQGPFAWGGVHGGPRGGAGPAGGDFSDFFSSMFGGQAGAGSPFGGAGRARRGGFASRGNDIESSVEVTLGEVLRGSTRKFRLSGGQGGDRTVEVRIPLGVREGGQLRIRGKGSPGMGGGPAGDLLLRVRVTPDPVFRRRGADLEVAVSVWPWQAVLGGEITVPVLGGQVKMRIPAGSQAGTRMKLKGKGLPGKKGALGDQYAILEVRVPKQVTDEERALYEGLAQLAASTDADCTPDS